ncbi:hypothetical protein TruAng_002855 [Truncatella angustata]|nr:hypothetical protein TruAng_002855 [Truncatella angustata]
MYENEYGSKADFMTIWTKCAYLALQFSMQVCSDQSTPRLDHAVETSPQPSFVGQMINIRQRLQSDGKTGLADIIISYFDLEAWTTARKLNYAAHQVESKGRSLRLLKSPILQNIALAVSSSLISNVTNIFFHGHGLHARFNTHRAADSKGIEESEMLLESLEGQAPPRNRGLYRDSMFVLKDIVLLVLAIPTLFNLFELVLQDRQNHIRQKPQSTPSLPGCNCGNSVAQALQLNCRYDTLAAAWLPDHCRDDELTELFNHSGDGPNGSWTYWADFEHTQELSVGQLGALADLPEGGVFYMTHRWHLVHCMFYWRKQIRSKTIGITLEPRYDTESHVQHCYKMFGEDGTRGAMSGVALNSNRWDAMR